MCFNWLKDYNLLDFETTDSTNSEALRLANSGVSGNFVITATTQTGGRGTKGRVWESFSGNLHGSILLEVQTPIQKNPQLSFVIANAMYEAIAKLMATQKVKADLALKWPNDILINEKKVAGILLESIKITDKNYVVIGFGVNLEKAPKYAEYEASSLRDEGVKTDSSHGFLNILMNKFEKHLKQWKGEGGFTKTRELWLKRAYNLNKVITINDGQKRISGIFKEIDFDGAIRIELASGQICSFNAGEVMGRTNDVTE